MLNVCILCRSNSPESCKSESPESSAAAESVTTAPIEASAEVEEQLLYRRFTEHSKVLSREMTGVSEERVQGRCLWLSVCESVCLFVRLMVKLNSPRSPSDRRTL